MSPEEQLDDARAKEAVREMEERNTRFSFLEAATIAARKAREGWTPPEPVVDPDVLAFREWGERRFGVNTASAYRLGDCDDTAIAEAYLAGARMAREQERERAKVPIGMAGVLVDRCQRMMHSLPPGVRAQWDAEWGLVALCREVAAEIAKYMGEA